METEKVSILIIGSGPAGYTAAIYAARANMKPLLYQGIQPGGQLTITTDVENYHGFPDGIQGPEMMVNFEKQAASMGTDIRYGLATKVDFSGDVKKVWIDDEKIIEADAVIISTGAIAKWLGIPSEEKFNGFGVSACAVCDGFFFKGKEVAIVGAGDTAAEEAHYLSKMCTTVHMIVRKDKMRASKVMQDRVLNTPNIKVYFNSETDEILGDKTVKAVRIKNTQTNTLQEIPVSAFFVAIGHNPNSSIFSEFIKIDETGYILTEPGTTKTNVPGEQALSDSERFQERVLNLTSQLDIFLTSHQKEVAYLALGKIYRYEFLLSFEGQ